MSKPGFWSDSEGANKIISEFKELKSRFEPWDRYQGQYTDILELSKLVEEDDQKTLAELQEELLTLSNALDKLEFEILLSGEDDKCSAILSINAGAGGTEACDWVQMLARMYIRWAEAKGFSTRTVVARSMARSTRPLPYSTRWACCSM